eukprot:scaffold200558_cov31-Tisochrysis_lutea.AAC.2
MASSVKARSGPLMTIAYVRVGPPRVEASSGPLRMGATAGGRAHDGLRAVAASRFELSHQWVKWQKACRVMSVVKAAASEAPMSVSKSPLSQWAAAPDATLDATPAFVPLTDDAGQRLRLNANWTFESVSEGNAKLSSAPMAPWLGIWKRNGLETCMIANGGRADLWKKKCEYRPYIERKWPSPMMESSSR